MTTGLFSRYLGYSSTFAAMTQFPEVFDGIRCLVGSQPVTMKTIVARRLARLGVPADRIDDLEQRIVPQTSIGFARRAPGLGPERPRAYLPLPGARRRAGRARRRLGDVRQHPRRRQATPVDYGTKRRWDGYLEFQRHPEPTLDWFAKHMS